MKLTQKTCSKDQPNTAKVQRKANLDRIRNSLQNFTLLKQNHQLTAQKITGKHTIYSNSS